MTYNATKGLWLPGQLFERRSPAIATPPQGYAVRWKTEILDSRHRVVKTQSGENMITDYGMDQLDSANVGVGASSGANLIDYLHLGDTTGALKRVGSTVNLTVTWTDPLTITLTTDANFFEAGDVGRSFKINGTTPWPEMLITAYASETSVSAIARFGGIWLPGFTPPASPAGPYTNFGVHYTNTSTLASQTQRFNTYDTGASNSRATVNDSANSRWICQRIFLSAAVTGSNWTVNQLGWGSSASTTNCFGITNLGSPDIVGVGYKYRVTLQAMMTYAPLNLTGVSLNWGATIGTHVCDLQQERIGKEGSNGGDGTTDLNKNMWNPLKPQAADFAQTGTRTGWWTGAFTLDGVYWRDDAGFVDLSTRTRGADPTVQCLFDSTYIAGQHYRTRRIRWPDTVAMTNATGLYCGQRFAGTGPAHYPNLSIRPQSGTITKPSGYWCEVQFPLHWTRELIN